MGAAAHDAERRWRKLREHVRAANVGDMEWGMSGLSDWQANNLLWAIERRWMDGQPVDEHRGGLSGLVQDVSRYLGG